VRRKLAAAGNDARGQPQPSRLLPLGKGGSPILVEVLIMMRDVVSINASLRGKHRNIVPADAVHRPASRAVRPLAVKAARYSILHARSLYHGKENSKSPVLWTQATYGVRSSGVPGAPLRTRPSPPKVHRAPAPPRSRNPRIRIDARTYWPGAGLLADDGGRKGLLLPNLVHGTFSPSKCWLSKPKAHSFARKRLPFVQFQ
jgi:hypothetical protein